MEETAGYWLFVGEFSETINHKQLGIIRCGTISYEYYFKNRWYNIFRFHEPEGEFRNFYCNINQPPTVSANVLNYIDLDVDVLVWKDFACEILDLDEFKINAEQLSYSKEVKKNVKKSVKELLVLIQNRQFPFDFV